MGLPRTGRLDPIVHAYDAVQRSPPLRRGKLAGPRGRPEVAVGVGAGLERPSARPADPGMMVAFDKVLASGHASSPCETSTLFPKERHDLFGQVWR